MTDRLQSIREQWEAATPETLRALADGDDGLVWLLAAGVKPELVGQIRTDLRNHAAAWKKREDDIAYLLRLAEAGEALAGCVEAVAAGSTRLIGGKYVARTRKASDALYGLFKANEAWRQAREG